MQFLSATIGPSVARVSAPRITPFLKMIPTIVVPVLIVFGARKPPFINASFRLQFSKLNPAGVGSFANSACISTKLFSYWISIKFQFS